jgi:hypothetical protein
MGWAFADGGSAHRIRGVLAGLLRPSLVDLLRSPGGVGFKTRIKAGKQLAAVDGVDPTKESLNV